MTRGDGVKDREAKIIGYVVMDFINEFKDAQKHDYIVNPVAYALYETWKKYDLMSPALDGEEKPNG